MTDLLGLLAYLVLPLIGLFVYRLKGVRRFGHGGALPIAGAAGALIVAAVMAVLSLVGVEWSRTRLLLLFTPIAVYGAFVARRQQVPAPRLRPTVITAAISILFAITLYGLLSARETCGDLLFFWGPKGVHFYTAGKIDVDYLRNPDNFLSHADYPPLLPLLFAWSNTLSRQFSWTAALLLTALCLAGIVSLIRAGTRDSLSALLAAAVLAYVFATGQVGGAADPVLLFFEAMAVTALLFIDHARTQTLIVALGVAGAVSTKVEGATFAVAIFLAMLLDRRPLKQSLAAIFPAAAVFGAWLCFVVRSGLLDTYRGNGEFSFRYLATVLRTTLQFGSYGAFWIPWIAPLLVIALGDIRRARLPLSMAGLTLGVVIYFYLNSAADPTFLIISSAPRVLLTPLLMLVIAAATAHAAVPQR
jgi:hypothetical protein